jgi:5-formyltetrahydrofolate cyclo-ligase
MRLGPGSPAFRYGVGRRGVVWHGQHDAMDPKRTLRTAMLAARSGCDPALGACLASHVMAGGILDRLLSGPRQSIAGFWPMGSEIDIRPLLHALVSRGYPILLPATPPRGQPLTFRRWRPGDAMLPDRFGTVAPPGEPGVPDMLLVPLLAWDLHGNRLGYGGGYYDRTLAGLPGRRAIGCAYAMQQVDRVPAGPHDVPLDAVATECGVTVFRTWPGC